MSPPSPRFVSSAGYLRPAHRGSPRATSQPCRPCSIGARVSLVAVATIGSPQAMASSKASEARLSRAGMTNRSAACRKSSTSSNAPANATFGTRLNTATNFTSWSASGPSPTIHSRAWGQFVDDDPPGADQVEQPLGLGPEPPDVDHQRARACQRGMRVGLGQGGTSLGLISGRPGSWNRHAVGDGVQSVAG